MLEIYVNTGQVVFDSGVWAPAVLLMGAFYFTVEFIKYYRNNLEYHRPDEKKPKHDGDDAANHDSDQP